jgi:hypothetical protein
MKSKSKNLWILLPILLLVGYGIYRGLQNDSDPYWSDLDGMLKKDYQTLDKSVDSLQYIYNNFQSETALDDSLAFKLVAKPYLPTMEFSKFKEYFNLILERKFIIVSGVTGSGNTTILARISDLIAEGEHRLDILCAPQFDLELHRKYVGYYDDNNVFHKGELLKFWERCKASPSNNFVCLIDNFDKINAETFMGPELWQKLDDSKFVVKFGNDTITIPDNFYMLCVTHAGVTARVEMNNEHFKRFGGRVNLPINSVELILALHEKIKSLPKDIKKKTAALESKPSDKKLTSELSKAQEQLIALQDTANVKRMVYFFEKANQLIAEKYSPNHQLGQWSDVRKQFLPTDYTKLQEIFLNHVNAFHPTPELKKEDFDGIQYTIANNGLLKNSNTIYVVGNKLASLGFVSEFGVAITFAIVTGLFGWYFVRQKNKEMRSYMQRIYKIMESFLDKDKDQEKIHDELKDLRKEFDGLVQNNKINYTEASFFYSFLEDKVRHIEVSKEVNDSFMKIVDAFLDDNVLTNSEYKKLNQFLDSIKHRISTQQYEGYMMEIERIRSQYGGEEK